MPKGKTPKTWQTRQDKLAMAWKRVKTDARDDFLPDLISYRDYEFDLAKNLRELLSTLPSYAPSPLQKIDIPKSPYFCRPGGVISVRDRIVYQAAVDECARRIEAAMESSNVVFGYRSTKVKNTEWMFDNNVKQWLKFRDYIRQSHEDGFDYMINTDLVGYFEHIEHQQLYEQLVEIGVRLETAKLLRKLWDKWSTSDKHGLPQGTNPSSLLGNFYLDPVDKDMTRAGVRYFRFMDDMCVFAKTSLDLKKAMRILSKSLRDRRLFLNVKKTEVRTGAQITQFADSRHDVLAAIDYDLETSQIGSASLGLKREMRSLRKERFKDLRLLKFVLNRLRRIGNPLAAADSFEVLPERPELSEVISKYLGSLVARKPKLAGRILAFVSSESNIFEWQEHWLLRSLMNCKRLTRGQLDSLRSRFRATSHWANKSACLLLLGKYGDRNDLSFVRKVYDTDQQLARAIVIAYQEMDKQTRNKFYDEIARDHPECDAVIALIKNSAKQIWPVL